MIDYFLIGLCVAVWVALLVVLWDIIVTEFGR